jgi:hypothetical protein
MRRKRLVHVEATISGACIGLQGVVDYRRTRAGGCPGIAGGHTAGKVSAFADAGEEFGWLSPAPSHRWFVNVGTRGGWARDCRLRGWFPCRRGLWPASSGANRAATPRAASNMAWASRAASMAATPHTLVSSHRSITCRILTTRSRRGHES